MKRNLLPPYIYKGPIQELFILFIFIVALLSLVYTGFFLYSNWQSSNLEAEIDEMDTKIEDTQDWVLNKESDLKQSEYYEDIKRRMEQEGGESLSIFETYPFNEFLSLIVDELETNILFFHSELGEDEFLLTGQAVDYEDIRIFYANFTEALEEYEESFDVEIIDIEVIPTVEGGNHAMKEVVVFSIQGTKEEVEGDETNEKQEEVTDEEVGADE